MLLAGIQKKSLDVGSPPEACGDKLRGHDDWISDVYVALCLRTGQNRRAIRESTPGCPLCKITEEAKIRGQNESEMLLIPSPIVYHYIPFRPFDHDRSPK
jgi:hypothetical protein